MWAMNLLSQSQLTIQQLQKSQELDAAKTRASAAQREIADLDKKKREVLLETSAHSLILGIYLSWRPNCEPN